MEIAEFIGERMMLARRRAGFSQLEVSRQLGVSPPTVSRWEQGLRGPDWEALYLLANFYSVDMCFFFEGLENAQIEPAHFSDASARVLALAA